MIQINLEEKRLEKVYSRHHIERNHDNVNDPILIVRENQ